MRTALTAGLRATDGVRGARAVPDDKRTPITAGYTHVLFCCSEHGWQRIAVRDTMLVGAFRAPFAICSCGQVCPLVARYIIGGIASDARS